MTVCMSVLAEPVADKMAEKTPLMSEPVGAGNYLQMMLGLVFVVFLIVGMAWFMRRMGTFQTTIDGAMKVVAGLSISQREKVVLIQVGETQILLGVAPGQIRTLHVLDIPLPMETSHRATSTSFAKRLHAVLKQKARS